MVQVSDAEILRKLINRQVTVQEAVLALIDRSTALFKPSEGMLLDYKQQIRPENNPSVAELARDILGFSNTEGGVLICGVTDDKVAVGHESLDFRSLRDLLGPYMGTRVNFDLDECAVNASGRSLRLEVVTVHRSSSAYPNQLRRDIELRPGVIRKIKYMRGTLFFRRDAETLAESPYGDIETRARDLGFRGAAPRTRTSFLLQEDRPGLRMYAPINDRFYGRDAELGELLSKFDDPRGRGISLAGFGGVGKTELAIQLVSELHRRGKFRLIYSGSAKQTLLGPAGSQPTDPVFIDLDTFLSDLAGWLGLNTPKLGTAELGKLCVSELKKLGPKVLLFVDNLETVTDRNLLDFIDNQLPSNCWVVATARVHKIRNFIYPKELKEMEADDAARLLRHELNRQGLKQFAALEISELRAKARSLYSHPLAIRWFAWACKKDATVWNGGIGLTDVREIETFCVAHTLGSLEESSRRVLGGLMAIEDVADPTTDCVQYTTGLSEPAVERALWELECSGLVQAVTDEDGITAYSVAALARRPAADLVRAKDWETEFVRRLQTYIKLRRDAPPESPLVRELLKLETRKISGYTKDEKLELITRVDRALEKCPDRLAVKLKWIKAECERHLGRLVSSDNLYKICADEILAETSVDIEPEKIRILIEAATVAKSRAQTEPQIRRAISYLERVRKTDVAPLRVLGMLTEMYAIVGDEKNHARLLKEASEYRSAHEDEADVYLELFDDAIERSKAHIAAKNRRG